MSKKITSEKSGNLSGTLPNFKMKTLALLTRSVICATLLPPEVYAELPDPCRGGCGPEANLSFVQAGDASHHTSNNTMTVTQNSDKAVLNWNSFNVSADAAVNFAQKNANSVALNRIFSGTPSKILGSVSANGQIYLINPSGILFGQTAKVNVGGLVASTLNVDTDTFMNSGIANALNKQNPSGTVAKDNFAAFRNKEEEWGEHDASQKIVVEAGASIKTHGDGNVMMVGKSVENNGSIEADDGQVLLVAAEDRVYLQPSEDLALRGFLVEVETGGEVSNRGEIKADRGNVTLAGHAVNQHGVIKATTSIDRNGSIYLQARDGGNVIAGTAGKKNSLTATRGGELSVGENSLTRIELELDSLDKAIDEQKPLQSQVKLSGQTIHIKENANIKAHNGVVDVVASSTPDKKLTSETGSTASRDDLAYIQMDRGATIDVQGADASLEMARNFVTLELYSSELKDSPLQRNGILRGEEITVDIRKGTPLADIQAAIAAIPKSLAERAAKGGTVNLISQGSVVLNEGSKIDVSGGETTYEGGFVSSTQLMSNGRIIDISEADPSLIYDGILGVYTRSDRENGVIYREGRPVARRFWESGYKAGNDAGAVNIAGYNMLLGADITSTTLVGRYQSKPDTQPLGGRITIGLPRALGSFTDNLAPSLVLSNAGYEGQRAANIQFAQIESAFRDETLLRLREQNPVFTEEQMAAALQVEWAKVATQTELSRRFANATGENNRAYINVDKWMSGGAQLIDINSNGTIELAAHDSALQLERNTALSLNAERLVLSRSITGAGAKLAFRSQADIAQAVRLDDLAHVEGIALADGISLDVSGEYLNDFQKITLPENRLHARDGGSIALKVDDGETLRFGSGNRLLADGGAYVSRTGKVADGKGGSITLDAAATDARYVFSARPINADDSVSASDGLVLSARALRDNGSLTLAAEGLVISDTPVTKATESGLQTIITSGDATGISSRSDLANQGNQLNLSSAFFEDGAFADYRLKASRGDVIIAAGTDIALVQRNVALTDAASDIASATTLRELANVETLDAGLRKAVDLSISQKTDFDADLVIGTDASIRTEAGGTLSFANGSKMGGARILVDGILQADAGQISFKLSREEATAPVNDRSMVWLGEHAELLSRGVLDADFNDAAEGTPLSQLVTGDVLEGGRIDISANGYVVMQEGALVDVSGTGAELDMYVGRRRNVALPYESRWVSSAAGQVNLTSGEGMVLNGEFRADSEAVGASVENSAITINSLFSDRNVTSASGPDPSDIDPARHIQVLANTPADRTEGLIKTANTFEYFSVNGQAIELGALAASNRGLTVLNATTLSESFDNMTLQTDGALSFGPVSGKGEHVLLSPERSLTIESKYVKLNAPQEGLNSATLESYAVSLGSERGAQGMGINRSGLAQAGEGSLSINGSNIDIDNSMYIDGIRSLSMQADNDIRLRETGTLSTAGDLLLTAREVVATTASDILLQALDIVSGESTQSGRIVINSNGKPVAPALAAQGKVNLNAARIEQNGALLAPFGQITLDAAHVRAVNNAVVRGEEGTLSLGSGSTTSVSLQNQQVPFGTTLNGLEWVYGPNNKKIFTDGERNILGASISLQGETVDIARGAQVDISGSGDLLAYEYIPGLGGSKDYLDINAGGLESGVERYAIFPALGNVSLPYDQKFSAGDHGPDVGMTLQIGSGSSVPAGEYLLLPAQYALLPGAYLVEKVQGYRDVVGLNNFKLLDGTPVVSGQIGVAGLETQSSRIEGFSVRAGSDARQFSEYRETSANQFFAERSALLDLVVAPARPVDAGLASIDANRVLRLDGSILGEAGEGGRLSALDISADNLRIVNASAQGDGSAVELTAEQLARLDVGSLLLGGRRSTTDDGLSIDVLAKQISVEAGVQVEGQEVILVAKQNVTVKEGAALTSTVPATQEQLSLSVNNGAAVAAVSQRFISAVNRSGSGTGSTIVVENNARVASENSVVLDATGSTTLAGLISAPGAVHLGASRVELGRVDGSGLVLDNATLAALSGVDLLGIQASEQMLLADGLSLNAGALRLTTPLLQGAMGASGQASINAQTLTLKGGAVADTAVSGQGGLALTVENLLLGGGQLTIKGLGSLDVSATESLQFVGDGHTRVGADTVNFNTPVVAGSDGVTAGMSTNGNLAFTSTAPAGSFAGGVGGKIEVDAASLYINNRWRFDSGVIGLNASTGDLSIGSDAELDVSGRAYQVYETTLFSDAGYLSMAAQQGRIDVQAGAILDTSAPVGGGNAGVLQLKALQGDVNMSGTLLSSAEQGQSGRLKIDAERLSGGLDGLAKLLDSSGARGGVDLRLRGGEQQVLSAGQVLKADDIALAFDQAGVEIHGQLDASGKRGGNIDVQANGDVFIGTGAGLLARGSENRGGDVRVSSHGGALSFAAGSTVDVSGGEGGDVVFRADIDDTRGVNIGDAGFAGSIIGARRARLEVHDTPYLDNGTFDQADADALRARAQAIQATADSIRARLLVDEQVDIVSSLEVVSQGAYNWSQEVNFDEWQSYTDAGTLADGSVLAGTLTVKATGNLSMLGGLSDGFNTEGLLSTQDSWSYRLVAGADLAAANALHTAVSQANFVVGKDTKIRTGNGRIDIASANDFSLTNRNSVVYSAGRNTGLVLDPNDALVFGIAGEKVVAAEGGHVSITAGHNLKGHAPAKGNGVRVQAWTDWLQDNGAVAEEVLIDPETGEPLIDAETGGYYYMRVQEDAGRFVNYAAFAQGIAAIGGGNLSLMAGQDIVRLDASLPTTIAVNSQTGLRTETGAGQLRVHAAGDVISSNFLIGEGEGSVTALGSIRAERTLADGRVAAGYTALAGGDFRYSARKDVTLLGAFDLSSVSHLFADGMDSSVKYYFSMDSDTAFSAMSIAGNLNFNTTLSVAQRNLFDLQGENLFASGPYSQDKIVPADFTLAALSGKTSVENLLSFAQADSTLVLWASDSLFLKSGVTLMDLPLAELPTLENPESPKGGGFDPRQGVQVSSLSALENEESNILLVATDGSVSMPSVFRSALPVDVFAAQDIDRINMVATHYDETDVSRFTAGRDIKLVSGAERISVAGPGRVDVMAGRNINLGSSKGIETVGATTNRQLQGREGADLFVFAGVRSSDLQYDGFIAPLLDNRSSMNSFATQVQSYVALVTTEKLSEREASERFRSLTLAQQNEFFKRVDMSVEQGNALLSALAYADAMGDTISRSGALRPLLDNLLATDTGLAALADSYRLHERSSAANSEVLAEISSLSEKDLQAIVHYGLVLLDEATRRSVVVNTFAGLNERDRKPLITHAFYNELKMSGRNANAGAPAGYDRGYQAVESFLTTASYAGDKVLNTTADGDLSLLLSKIYTVDGGDINLLVPGGLVNAGVVTPPLGGVSKEASELGIVVQGAGDVRAYLYGDFLVNQSRVFTLEEGNINMWSSAGNIDAGRGAKSAIAAPAPTVSIDDQGNVIIDTAGAVAGSGIRQIDTTAEEEDFEVRLKDVVSARSLDSKDDGVEAPLKAILPARAVDLVAPIGEINAGDAGIGASGNINIAAARVIGADNIDIGGVAVGVPVADTAGFSGGFSGADGAAAAVNKASEDAAESTSDTPAADDALAWLEVTFAGFGDELSSDEGAAEDL